MSFRYIIEGNIIKREEIMSSEIGRVSDLLPRLTSFVPLSLGRLPKNISFLKLVPEGQDTIRVRILVSQDPQVRPILFNESHGGSDSQQTYRIGLPYVHFWFDMRGTPPSALTGRGVTWAPTGWGVMFSRTPFDDMATHQATHARLPNMWTDTRCCFGTNPITANQSLGAYIDQLINTFWTSEFNTDLHMSLPYGDDYRRALSRWQAAPDDDWTNWTSLRSDASPMQTVVEAIAGGDWEQPGPDSMEAPMPEVPIQLTWRRVSDWLDDIEPDMVARLRDAIATRPA